MKDRKVVLASASPRRRELLAQIGIEAAVIPSSIEERITKTSPELVVMELSKQKAEDVAKCCEEGCLVIGADTVVTAAGQILGKPKSHESAYQMLDALQGTVHQVYTGVTLILKGKDGDISVTFAEKTDVQVYPMKDEEIRCYADSEDPMDKAGAYGIQGKFAAFVRSIDGDYNNVVGLPVGRVYQEIKQLEEQEESGND